MNSVRLLQQDLFAIWNTVLDRMRPTDMSATSRAPSADEPIARDDVLRRGASFSSLMIGSARNDETVKAPVAQASAPLHAGVVCASVVNRAAHESKLHPDAQISPTGVIATASDVRLSTVEPTVQRAAVAARAAQEASRSSSDSVIVIVDGAGVSIVVRDAAVADHQAVGAAFATAADLTGRRDALVQLTLNGRTLYRQPAAVGTPRPSHRLPRIII